MKKHLRSFQYAANGLRICFLSEINFRIHLLAAITAAGAGWYFRINRAEWIAVIGSIAAVLMAELFNTAIEQLCNLVSPGHNLIIGKVKDLSAAAVLVSAIMAAVTGLVIFLKYIILWIN